MIKSDSRYIIKKVLIYVLTALILAFLSSKGVLASESVSNYSIVDNPDSYYYNNPDYDLVTELNYGYFTGSYFTRVYYSSEFNYLYITQPNNTKFKKSINIPMSPQDYDFKNFVIYKTSTAFYLTLFESDTITAQLGTSGGQNNKFFADGYKETLSFGYNSLPSIYSMVLYNDTESPSIPVVASYDAFKNTNLQTSSVNISRYGSTASYIESNYVIDRTPKTPTILDLGYEKIVNKNIVVGYNFKPNYSFFNTNDFKYTYRFDDSRELIITENKQLIKIRANGSVYFNIYNLDNDLVYSETFTITNVSNQDIAEDYDIVYDYQCYNHKPTDESISNFYESCTLYFDYFPKLSKYKYQYQFVKENDSLSDWKNISYHDSYKDGYTTESNGTLYARILDENDNILYSSSFTVTNIGKFAIPVDNVNGNKFFNRLRDKINYGSSISSIFFLPVDVLQVIVDSSKNAYCQDINLGSLLGHNLTLPCINFESLVGNNIYHFIDLVGAFAVGMGMVIFIINTYNNVISLNFNPQQEGDDSKKRGDFN